MVGDCSMPYRSYEKRTRNYDLAVIPDNVRAKFEARKSAMLDGQEEAQAMIVEVETCVREVCDEHGIVGNMRIPYLNFARALIRAKGHNSGLALVNIKNAEKAKFTALGLDPDILDEVAKCVVPEVGY